MKNRLYKIEQLDNYTCIEFERGAEITLEIVMEVVDQLNSRYATKGRHDLWDFRGCPPSPNLGYDAMARIVDDIESRTGDKWAEKSALLVDDTIQYGLSRMFQILADGYPTQISVFQSEADARHWISRRLNSEA